MGICGSKKKPSNEQRTEEMYRDESNFQQAGDDYNRHRIDQIDEREQKAEEQFGFSFEMDRLAAQTPGVNEFINNQNRYNNTQVLTNIKTKTFKLDTEISIPDTVFGINFLQKEKLVYLAGRSSDNTYKIVRLKEDNTKVEVHQTVKHSFVSKHSANYSDNQHSRYR